MNIPTSPNAPFSVDPPPRFPRAHWRRGTRAMRDLIQNADDTEKAQDVSLAIGNGDEERRFQRFARSPEGQRLLREGPLLLEVLSDREALAQLPPNSLGRAYLAYMQANEFEPSGLIELRRRAQARWERAGDAPPVDPARSWFRDRVMLCHDLFHVVSGYGTDGVGEATLLLFSLKQMRSRATALLAFGAALEVWRWGGADWLRYGVQAWRRGRAARHLLAQPWEELLPIPLTEVRARLGITPPGEAHPAGLLRGDRDANGAMQLARSG